ncbi:MAG: hypothetical protein R6U26_03950 [Candidatus Undinarchaeales archaeon]
MTEEKKKKKKDDKKVKLTVFREPSDEKNTDPWLKITGADEEEE